MQVRFRRPQVSALPSRRAGSWLLAAALLAAVAMLVPLHAGFAADFTPDQRKAIEAIIHDYLTKNPDVLLDALQAAEDKMKGDAKDKAAQALSTRRREIFEDPDTPFAGNPNGDVSLVEFFDYRCPYCKRSSPRSRLSSARTGSFASSTRNSRCSDRNPSPRQRRRSRPGSRANMTLSTAR
jgi:hypothetical protein